jgi:hypothetical protein
MHFYDFWERLTRLHAVIVGGYGPKEGGKLKEQEKAPRCLAGRVSNTA